MATTEQEKLFKAALDLVIKLTNEYVSARDARLAKVQQAKDLSAQAQLELPMVQEKADQLQRARAALKALL